MARLDVSSFPSVAAANAAWSAGDTLYFPNNAWTAPSGGVVLTGPGEIHMEPGATLAPAVNTDPVIDLQMPAGITDRVWIHGGKLLGGSVAAHTGGYGIKCELTSTAVLRNLVIQDLGIASTGDSGIHMKGNNGGANNFEFPVIKNVMVENCWNRGIAWLDGAFSSGGPLTGGIMDTVFILNNKDWGTLFQACQCVFQNCYWEQNATVSTGAGQCFVSSGEYVFLNPHIEDFATSAIASGSDRGIVAQNAHGLTVWGGGYVNGTEVTSSGTRCAISITAGSGPCHAVVGPGRVSNVTRFIEVGAGVTKAEIYEQFVVNGSQPVYDLPTGMHLKRWS